LHRSARKLRASREAQEETRGLPKRCEVADDSVVVKKSRPEKAGNRLEEKTGTICSLVYRGHGDPKGTMVAKGGSSFQELWKEQWRNRLSTKSSGRTGHEKAENL
jgi:hypothetical protein